MWRVWCNRILCGYTVVSMFGHVRSSGPTCVGFGVVSTGLLCSRDMFSPGSSAAPLPAHMIAPPVIPAPGPPPAQKEYYKVTLTPTAVGYRAFKMKLMAKLGQNLRATLRQAFATGDFEPSDVRTETCTS